MTDHQQILQAGIDGGAAPGAAAVIVDRNGVVWEGAAGERSIGAGTAMTTDTVGAIFSMTKALTCAAAMHLVERGLLDLDAPAGTVIPYLGEVQVLDGFDGDGQPVLRPPTTQVTLRHLLSHTSGFVYDTWNQNDLAYRKLTKTPPVASLLDASLEVPLAFDPGTKWEYGIGPDWVGKMVEAASGTTLGSYLAEHITGPLGMVDTAFESSASMLERSAAVHARLADGSFAPIELKAPPAPEFEMGGGGLRGTAIDYARFIRMILDDGELDGVRVLQADTVKQMCENQIGELHVSQLVTKVPGTSNDVEFFPGQPKSWSLAFQINEEPADTGRPAGALMWAGLANSYYWIDRRNGIGGVYLSQVFPFGDEQAMDLFFEVEREAYRTLTAD